MEERFGDKLIVDMLTRCRTCLVFQIVSNTIQREVPWWGQEWSQWQKSDPIDDFPCWRCHSTSILHVAPNKSFCVRYWHRHQSPFPSPTSVRLPNLDLAASSKTCHCKMPNIIGLERTCQSYKVTSEDWRAASRKPKGPLGGKGLTTRLYNMMSTAWELIWNFTEDNGRKGSQFTVLTPRPWSERMIKM